MLIARKVIIEHCYSGAQIYQAEASHLRCTSRISSRALNETLLTITGSPPSTETTSTLMLTCLQCMTASWPSWSSFHYFVVLLETVIVLSSMDGEEGLLFVVGPRCVGIAAAKTVDASDQTCSCIRRLAKPWLAGKMVLSEAPALMTLVLACNKT